MDDYTAELNKLGMPYHVEKVTEFFRFGGGERLCAKELYTVPIGLFGKIVGLLRVCVIREGKGNELELL